MTRLKYRIIIFVYYTRKVIISLMFLISTCFIKTYPVVEKEEALNNSQTYVPLPNREELQVAALSAFGFHSERSDFSPTRDGCDVKETKPIFHLTTKRGSLTPVVMIDSNGMIFGCVLRVTSTESTFNFINGVGKTYEFLTSFGKYFLDQRKKSPSDLESYVMASLLFLSIVCPFGSPKCVDGGFADSLLSKDVGSNPARHLQKHPIPVWRMHSETSGNRQIQFDIRESVNSVQHHGPSGSYFSLSITGLVTCTAQIPGHLPEISISLSCADQNMATSTPKKTGLSSAGVSPIGRIDRCLHHPCCTYTDYRTNTQSKVATSPIPASQSGLSCIRLRFHPPATTLNLLTYTVPVTSELSAPIIGQYQMQSQPGCRVSLVLRLRIADWMPMRDYRRLDVLLPFPNRPSIADINKLNVTQGNLRILESNRHVLCWDLGSSIRSRDLTLSGDIKFHEKASRHPLKDLFCVHQNIYAQVNFLLADFTVSGLAIDTRSLLCSSDSSAKLLLNREFSSLDCKIWNSLGDVPTEYQINKFS